jgi:uncharacterized protein
MFSVQCNDPTSMKALIMAGANVNTKNRLGVTALILAAFRDSSEAAKVLLNAGADIEATWAGGGTALYEAAQRGHDSVARLLMQKGANVNFHTANNGWTPLMIAAVKNHYSTVSLLIPACADLNARDQLESTALTFATSTATRTSLSY